MSFPALLSVAALLTVGLAQGVELHNVQADDTLGQIKAKYPNAKFSRVNAAWVQETEAFFSMRGPGFPGTLYMSFMDVRPLARKKVVEEPNEDLWKAVSEASDEAVLSIQWVRWIPDEPIPMARFEAVHGKPTKCGYSEDTMKPICGWGAKNMMVVTSDDRRMVTTVEGQFTPEERARAKKRSQARNDSK